MKKAILQQLLFAPPFNPKAAISKRTISARTSVYLEKNAEE